MAKKTADQLEREMTDRMRRTTPEQQRNIDRRAAEQNRSYGDANRTKRSNAEIDSARKKSDALKPPRAPMMDEPVARKKGIKRLAEMRAAKKDYKSSKIDAARTLGQSSTAGPKDQEAYSRVRKDYEGKANAAAAKLNPKKIDKMESSRKLRTQTEKAFQEGKQYTAKNSSDPFTKKSSFNYAPAKKPGVNFARIKALGKILGRGGKALGVAGFVPDLMKGGEAFTQKKPSKKDPRFQG